MGPCAPNKSASHLSSMQLAIRLASSAMVAAGMYAWAPNACAYRSRNSLRSSGGSQVLAHPIWSDLRVIVKTTCSPALCELVPIINGLQPSQRSLHNAPIFRLLLKVAVNGTHQCDFHNFCGALGPQQRFMSRRLKATMLSVHAPLGMLPTQEW